MPSPAIPITGDLEADLLLEREPLALLIGMLLGQQVQMEWAFKGPSTLRDRLGGELDATKIAAMDQEEFVAICCAKPAIHRFPAVMGRRIHELCIVVTGRYDGDASKVWKRVRSAQVLHDRLRELPGYGEEKTKIFMAILAKRFDRRPEGWETVAAPFSDHHPRSVADVHSDESLQQVRAWKQQMRAERKSEQDQPV